MTVTLGTHREPVLLTSSGGGLRAWSCADCGSVFASGTAEKTAREHCAQRICECGQVLKEHYTICVDCLRLSEMEQRNAERDEGFKTAKKIPWRDYWRDNEHAQVYCQVDDSYYSDAETLLDDGGYDDYEMPTWAWACTSIKLRMDAKVIIDDALKEHYDGAGGELNSDDDAQLQKLLDAWCAKKFVETFIPDYTRIVTFEDIVQERLTDQYDEDEVSEGK